jgi:hypothetical protein
MARIYEVQSHGFAPTRTFDTLEAAEDYAETLVVAEGALQVELHRLVTRLNGVGMLPETVTNIIRLDVFSIEDNRLVRKQCNIF